MQVDMKERVALVVGAGGGFGSAIAVRLAADGVAVALAGRSTGKLEQAADKIRRDGGRAIVVTGDVREEQDVARICEKAARELGSPTILIDAAAVPGPFGPIGEFDAQEWWAALTLHVKAPVLLIQKLLPEMLRLGQGHVVILSSIVGQMVYPYLSAYGVGKGAQTRLVAHAAAELRDTGIALFAIQPGFAQTDLSHETLTSPAFKKWARESVERIQAHLATVDHDQVLRACGERCAELVSGKYDKLSGSFLSPEDDLDQLLSERA
jgi:NAD(P)-dependent dehydrogenase (short-subunit alcohol dehydrogenase family)